MVLMIKLEFIVRREQYKEAQQIITSTTSDATYYIDPNGGSPLDALEVACKTFEDHEGMFTCVKPTEYLIVSDTRYKGKNRYLVMLQCLLHATGI